MARLKLVILNIFFVLIIYVSIISGLLIAAEIQSSAGKAPTNAANSAVEQPRPIAPQRNISQQRVAPLQIDAELLPFWSR